MEKYILATDIKVICVTATSFPQGIQLAYKTLHDLLNGETRRVFGISHSSKEGAIIYRAAAEEAYEGEAEKLHCERFTIRKGAYISETLKDWKKDETIVARTFQQLLANPDLDPEGYCLEMYPNGTDMICLVKLKSDD